MANGDRPICVVVEVVVWLALRKPRGLHAPALNWSGAMADLVRVIFFVTWWDRPQLEQLGCGWFGGDEEIGLGIWVCSLITWGWESPTQQTQRTAGLTVSDGINLIKEFALRSCCRSRISKSTITL